MKKEHKNILSTSQSLSGKGSLVPDNGQLA